jgi:COMPASS component SWD3
MGSNSTLSVFLSLILVSFIPVQAQPSKPTKTLMGHSDSVAAIAFSADNKNLISGSRDKTIKIWDVNSKKLMRTLEIKSEGITAIAIYQHILAAADIDHSVKIWNFKTGKLLLTINAHSLPVEAVAISPDGKLVVTGSDDRTIKIWDITTGRLLHTLTGHPDYISNLAISPDGKTLVSGSGDADNKAKLYGNIKIWNLQTGKLIHSLKQQSPVRQILITPDGKTIFSGSFGQLQTAKSAINTIFVWDLRTGTLVRNFSENSASVESMTITKDGRVLIIGNFSGSINFWDWQKRKLLQTWKSDTDPIRAIALSPDQKNLATSANNSIKLWETPSKF